MFQKYEHSAVFYDIAKQNYVSLRYGHVYHFTSGEHLACLNIVKYKEGNLHVFEFMKMFSKVCKVGQPTKRCSSVDEQNHTNCTIVLLENQSVFQLHDQAEAAPCSAI